MRLMGNRKVFTSQRAMGAALLLLALLSGVTSYIQTDRTNQISTCVAAYQTGFSRALKARTDGQGSFNAALNHLVTTVASSSTPQEVKAALTDYIASAAQRDADLHANPYPDPSVCN